MYARCRYGRPSGGFFFLLSFLGGSDDQGGDGIREESDGSISGTGFVARGATTTRERRRRRGENKGSRVNRNRETVWIFSNFFFFFAKQVLKGSRGGPARQTEASGEMRG
jgi:hypothetical protein